MVPFQVLNVIRHRIFRGTKGDPDFDNHPYRGSGFRIFGSMGAPGVLAESLSLTVVTTRFANRAQGLGFRALGQ